jgi:hypothetical protein
MTGPLKNTRHERFVQALLQGESAVDAYEHAGFRRDDGNAAKLKAHPKVQERLAELQTEVAKDTKVTVESLMSELDIVLTRATTKEQYAAAVGALREKIKLSGLAVQKVEIGGPGSFENCKSTKALVDELLQYCVNPSYHDVRAEDRKTLIEIFDRQTAETNEYIESIKARPYISNSPAKQITVSKPSGNGAHRV